MADGPYRTATGDHFRCNLLGLQPRDFCRVCHGIRVLGPAIQFALESGLQDRRVKFASGKMLERRHHTAWIAPIGVAWILQVNPMPVACLLATFAGQVGANTTEAPLRWMIVCELACLA